MAGIIASILYQSVQNIQPEEAKRLLALLKKRSTKSREYGRALVLFKFLLNLKKTLNRHPRHASGRLTETALQQKLFADEAAKGERLVEKAKKIILEALSANPAASRSADTPPAKITRPSKPHRPDTSQPAQHQAFLTALCSENEPDIEMIAADIMERQAATFFMLQASLPENTARHPLYEAFAAYFEQSAADKQPSLAAFFYKICRLQQLRINSPEHLALTDECVETLMNASGRFTNFDFKAGEYLLRLILLKSQNEAPSTEGFGKIWRLFKAGWDKKLISPTDKLSLRTYFNIARSGYELKDYAAVRRFTSDFKRFFQAGERKEAARIKVWFHHLIDVAEGKGTIAPAVKLKSRLHNVFFRTALVCEYFDDPDYAKGVVLRELDNHSRYLLDMMNREMLEKQYSLRFQNFFEMVKTLIALRFDDLDTEKRTGLIDGLEKDFEEKKNGQLTQTLWLSAKLKALGA